MKKKLVITKTDEGVRYSAFMKNHWWGHWQECEFELTNGERKTALTLDDLGEFFGWYIPQSEFINSQDINTELYKRYNERLVNDHCENVYHINKWVDPEHTREVETVSGAKEIGDLSDGYHTFNELYYYRMLYNALWINGMSVKVQKELNVHKSKKHHDGNECFDGNWFIVSVTLPNGQVTNHYEMKYWDLFNCEVRETADEWDGHTPQVAVERMKEYLIL